jgi:hypothetical protein
LIAFFVGRIASLILRRVASFFTSSMTGKAPVPVPIHQTLALPGYGISSSMEIGVCPKAPRNFLDGFFLRLLILPAIDHHVALIGGPVNADRTE